MKKYFYWTIILLAFGWAFLSQLEMEKANSLIIKDGLGRILYPSPYLLRGYFGIGKLWCGLKGLTIDYIVFFCGIITAYKLIKKTSTKVTNK